MNDDHFPTFRRAGRWLAQAVTSRRLWRVTAMTVVASAGGAGVGLVAAFAARNPWRGWGGVTAMAVVGSAGVAGGGLVAAFASRNACSARAHSFVDDRLAVAGLL